MFVVIIHERDGLNVVGPFWHRYAAEQFVATLAENAESEIASVTDREKFSRASAV